MGIGVAGNMTMRWGAFDGRVLAPPLEGLVELPKGRGSKVWIDDTNKGSTPFSVFYPGVNQLLGTSEGGRINRAYVRV
jgi:hypothetical protein